MVAHKQLIELAFFIFLREFIDFISQTDSWKSASTDDINFLIRSKSL